MKIALLGYGRMGKTIKKLAIADDHTIVYKTNEKFDPKKLEQADVAIDFSFPEAAFDNITGCLDLGVPVVSGTTGWLDKYDEVVKRCEQKKGSFLYASNFSIGVNLFFALNKTLAKMMKNLDNYKPTIEEIHHTKKLDKPSGTAITLAEDLIVNSTQSDWKLVQNNTDSNLSKKTIPVVAKRFEDVKGTHKIQYESSIDAIEIKHTAYSREGFAKGAILAAKYIHDKKGVFTMQDVLQNII